MKSSGKPVCPYQFVVIEGNIGAGKTSLATLLGQEYSAKLILERFAENPFLPKFYEDRERYAFPVEMSFLTDRYNQLKRELQVKNLFSPFIIADYYFMKCLIFSRNTLAPDEYNLYSQLFHIINPTLPKPDLYVYLHLEPDRLLWNIENRGREYERSITAEYLHGIQDGYFEFFRQHPEMRILVIDMHNVDFVKNDADYRDLVQLIFEGTYQPGLHRCSIR